MNTVDKSRINICRLASVLLGSSAILSAFAAVGLVDIRFTPEPKPTIEVVDETPLISFAQREFKELLLKTLEYRGVSIRRSPDESCDALVSLNSMGSYNSNIVKSNRPKLCLNVHQPRSTRPLAQIQRIKRFGAGRDAGIVLHVAYHNFKLLAPYKLQLSWIGPTTSDAVTIQSPRKMNQSVVATELPDNPRLSEYTTELSEMVNLTGVVDYKIVCGEHACIDAVFSLSVIAENDDARWVIDVFESSSKSKIHYFLFDQEPTISDEMRQLSDKQRYAARIRKLFASESGHQSSNPYTSTLAIPFGSGRVLRLRLHVIKSIRDVEPFAEESVSPDDTCIWDFTALKTKHDTTEIRSAVLKLRDIVAESPPFGDFVICGESNVYETLSLSRVFGKTPFGELVDDSEGGSDEAPERQLVLFDRSEWGGNFDRSSSAGLQVYREELSRLNFDIQAANAEVSNGNQDLEWLRLCTQYLESRLQYVVAASIELSEERSARNFISRNTKVELFDEIESQLRKIDAVGNCFAFEDQVSGFSRLKNVQRDSNSEVRYLSAFAEEYSSTSDSRDVARSPPLIYFDADDPDDSVQNTSNGSDVGSSIYIAVGSKMFSIGRTAESKNKVPLPSDWRQLRDLLLAVANYSKHSDIDKIDGKWTAWLELAAERFVDPSRANNFESFASMLPDYESDIALDVHSCSLNETMLTGEKALFMRRSLYGDGVCLFGCGQTASTLSPHDYFGGYGMKWVDLSESQVLLIEPSSKSNAEQHVSKYRVFDRSRDFPFGLSKESQGSLGLLERAFLIDPLGAQPVCPVDTAVDADDGEIVLDVSELKRTVGTSSLNAPLLLLKFSGGCFFIELNLSEASSLPPIQQLGVLWADLVANLISSADLIRFESNGRVMSNLPSIGEEMRIDSFEIDFNRDNAVHVANKIQKFSDSIVVERDRRYLWLITALLVMAALCSDTVAKDLSFRGLNSVAQITDREPYRRGQS